MSWFSLGSLCIGDHHEQNGQTFMVGRDLRDSRPTLQSTDERAKIPVHLQDWKNISDPVNRRSNTFYCILMKSKPLHLICEMMRKVSVFIGFASDLRFSLGECSALLQNLQEEKARESEQGAHSVLGALMITLCSLLGLGSVPSVNVSSVFSVASIHYPKTTFHYSSTGKTFRYLQLSF